MRDLLPTAFSTSRWPISALPSRRLMTVETIALRIPGPKRRRHASGIADGGELLVGDHHEVRHVIEAVEHGQVRARHVEHRVRVLRRGELQDGAEPPQVHHSGAGRSADASSSTPDVVLTTRLLQKLGVKPMQVLKRVEQRESRIGAEEDGRIPVGKVQVDEQRRALRQLRQHRRDVDRRRGRANATLGADEREHGPPLTWVRWPSSRAIAASNSACWSGSAMYSLTPARIPSSISAGSSAEARSTTFVDGCCRLSADSSEGTRWPPRTSTSRMSGWTRFRINQGAEVGLPGDRRNASGCLEQRPRAAHRERLKL